MPSRPRHYYSIIRAGRTPDLPAGSPPLTLRGRSALVPGVLDRGGRIFRRGLPGGDRDGIVVDDPADRRPELLVKEILVPGRVGDVLRDLLDQRVGDRGIGSLDRRDVGAGGGGLVLLLGRTEEFQE